MVFSETMQCYLSGTESFLRTPLVDRTMGFIVAWMADHAESAMPEPEHDFRAALFIVCSTG